MKVSALTQTIEKLKQLTLKKEADFSECLNYFLDLVESEQFFAAGQLLKGDDTLFKLLLKPVCDFFGKDITVSSLYLITMKQDHLIHGTAVLSNHKMVMLYYFDDIECGIASAATLGGNADFFRITLLQKTSFPTPLLSH